MLTIMQRLFERLFPKAKEKIEITIELSESWEVHHLEKTKIRYCSKCGTETFFVPGNLAQEIVHADDETIAQLLANKNLHLSGSPENKSLICLKSLKTELTNKKIKFL